VATDDDQWKNATKAAVEDNTGQSGYRGLDENPAAGAFLVTQLDDDAAVEEATYRVIPTAPDTLLTGDDAEWTAVKATTSDDDEPTVVTVKAKPEDVAPAAKGADAADDAESADDTAKKSTDPADDGEPASDKKNDADDTLSKDEDPADKKSDDHDSDKSKDDSSDDASKDDEPTLGTQSLDSQLIQPLAAGADGANPPYVYWETRDVTGVLRGGATYQLQGPRTSTVVGVEWGVSWNTTITVTDCTASPCAGPDLDPDPGEFLVKQIGTHDVVSSNRYRVSQVTPPTGYNFEDTSNAWVEIPTSGWSWTRGYNNPSGWHNNNTYNFGSFKVRVIPPMAPTCDAGWIYAVSAAGQLRQVKPDGTVSNLGTSASGVSYFNGLGIGAGGSPVYAIERSAGSGSNQNATIYVYNTTAGTWSSTGYSTSSLGGDTGTNMIGGAVNLSNGLYYFGGFTSGGKLKVYEYNPSATPRIKLKGTVVTAATSAENGDIAFNASGDLFVVHGSGTTTTVYSVTAATFNAANGGNMASSQSASRTTADGVNGVAFDSSGKGYLGSGTVLRSYAMPGWVTPGTTVVSSGLNSTDLASCSSPVTITLEKYVQGARVGTDDQFTLTLSQSGTSLGTATTQGNTSGLQEQRVGPQPTVRGTTLTFTETASGTTAVNNYASSWSCYVDDEPIAGASGAGRSGSVTIPASGEDVKCRFTNAPLVANVTIDKTLVDVDGESNPRPGQSWPVTASTQATTGTVTSNPTSANQTTNASGEASWRLTFGASTARATVSVSETQQNGYAFVSGQCVVASLDGTVRTITLNSASAQALTGVAPGDTVACEYVNKQVPPGAISCTVDSVYVVNQLSQAATGGGYTNKLQNLNVTNNTVTDLVDLSATIPRETNGLGISSDGRYFYMIDFNIGVVGDPHIYQYDAVTGAVTTFNAAKGGTANDNGLVRRGGVDLKTGIYYYSTTQLNGSAATAVHNLYALNPSTGASWYVGTVTTQHAGASGDLAFDNLGNMYFVVGINNNAYVNVYDGRDLPTTPNATPIAITTKYLNVNSGAGNGVGVAYGLNGYLYTSNTAAEYFQVDPSTGSTLAGPTVIPQGTGVAATSGRSVDLSTCVSPSTLTVKKNLPNGRVGTSDQFTLSAHRTTTTPAGTAQVGQNVATDGSATGVQDKYVGPVPILTGTNHSYTVREASSALDNYGTSYRCIDTEDSTWAGVSGAVATTGGTRNATLGVIPAATGSKSRAIECTFTNQATKVVVLKRTQDSKGEGEAPRAGWPVNATTSVTRAPDNAQNTIGASGLATWTLSGFTAATQTATVNVSETQQSGYELVVGATSVCTITPLTGAVRTVSITSDTAATVLSDVRPGDQVSCTYVNKVKPATVTISKQVQDFAGQNPAGASGWTVGAALSAPTSASVSISLPSTQVTASGGSVATPWRIDFPQWATAGTMPTTGTRVHEVLSSQTGYEFVSGSCTITRNGTAQEPIAITGPFTGDPAGVVPGVQPGDAVACTFTNKPVPGTVTWQKVDEAGNPLANSVWEVVGPDGDHSATITVEDNTGQDDYAGRDTDERAGYFVVEEEQ
jgi:hypothetical protein